MSSVVTDDAALRQDLRIARANGTSLRRFWGWEPRRFEVAGETVLEPEFDAWERALWRAYDDWEQGHCPGCGEPLSESIFAGEYDPADPDHGAYRAGYDSCMSCYHLERAQSFVAERDEKRQPKTGPRLPSAHRKWAVQRTERDPLTR